MTCLQTPRHNCSPDSEWVADASHMLVMAQLSSRCYVTAVQDCLRVVLLVEHATLG